MNRIMIKRIVQLGALSVLGMGLASCGGSNGSYSTSTPALVVPPTPLEDRFGTGFGTFFRMAANTPATKPAATDIIAVSLTTQPMALH